MNNYFVCRQISFNNEECECVNVLSFNNENDIKNLKALTPFYRGEYEEHDSAYAAVLTAKEIALEWATSIGKTVNIVYDKKYGFVLPCGTIESDEIENEALKHDFSRAAKEKVY